MFVCIVMDYYKLGESLGNFYYFLQYTTLSNNLYHHDSAYVFPKYFHLRSTNIMYM